MRNPVDFYPPCSPTPRPPLYLLVRHGHFSWSTSQPLQLSITSSSPRCQHEPHPATVSLRASYTSPSCFAGPLPLLHKASLTPAASSYQLHIPSSHSLPSRITSKTDPRATPDLFYPMHQLLYRRPFSRFPHTTTSSLLSSAPMHATKDMGTRLFVN